MYICFAEAKHQFGTCFNTLAAKWTGGRFCHVAVVFEIKDAHSNKITFQEVSVVKTGHHEQDVVKLQSVENFDDWTCFKFTFMDPLIEIQALEYVRKVWENKEYDVEGSFLDFTLCCFFPRGYRSLSTDPNIGVKKTYCSRLTMHILQYCGLFIDHDPEKVSPNEIYRLIKRACTNDDLNWEDVTTSMKKIISGRRDSIWMKTQDGIHVF